MVCRCNSLYISRRLGNLPDRENSCCWMMMGGGKEKEKRGRNLFIVHSLSVVGFKDMRSSGLL